jgi:hypothetical protein
VTRTDWLPGLLVLCLGLVAAALFLLLGRRRTPAVGPGMHRDPAEEAGERAARLIDQLRELEADRHQLAPDALAAERARLERLAAAALRSRDEARASAAAPDLAAAVPAAAARSFFERHPQLQGALWGAGLVVFFGALGLWLTRDAQPRGERDGLTGTAGRDAPAPTPPAEDPAFATALAEVRENPGDVETSAHVVHELIRRQDYDQARLLTERSLGVDPFLAEARVHRAFLRAVGGEEPAAAQELEHLAGLYPRAHEALLFLGMLRMRAGNNRGAVEAFERFLAEAPPDEQPPQLRAAIADLRRLDGNRP